MEDSKHDLAFWGLSATTINHVRDIIKFKIQDYESRIEAYKEFLAEMDKEASKYAQFEEVQSKEIKRHNCATDCKGELNLAAFDEENKK